MVPRLPVAALLAALLATGPARGQEEEAPPAPERIERTVTVLREEDETPIEGATVEIREDGGGGRVTVRTTGKDGRAVFPDSPLRGASLTARAPGRAFAFGDVEDAGRPACGNWRRESVAPLRAPVVRLSPGRVVEGRVLSSVDGKPVAGIPVRACSERIQGFETTEGNLRFEPVPCWTAVTDELGRYRTDQGVAEDHSIAATTASWVSDRFSFSTHPHRGVPPKDLDLVVHPAGTLRGLVLDEGNVPVPGISVVAEPPEGVKAIGLRTLGRWTDERGRFALEGAVVGIPYALRASGPEARSRLSHGLAVARQSGEAACELRILPLGGLLVRVARGSGLKLFLVADLQVPEEERPLLRKTDEEAGFGFQDLLPGKYALRVDARGWLPLVREVEVVGGKTVEVDVDLSPGAALEGTVVDEAGEAVPNLRMHAANPTPEHPEGVADDEEEAFSDEEGRFRFEGLREGPVRIRLDRGMKGYVLDPVLRATAPGKGLKIVVRRK